MERVSTSFEPIEREPRTHLAQILSAGGFGPASEIEALTVNRWPHGYAFTPHQTFAPEYGPSEAPHEIGFRQFGRIAIANSDADAPTYLDCAIDEAWSAASELDN